MKHILSIAKYSTNWRFLAVPVEILLYSKRILRIINVILEIGKKKNVAPTSEMPWLHSICVLKMWKLCTQQHCPMWKANVYLFRKKIVWSVWSVACTCIPQAPLHVLKREIIYLSVYWFKDSKNKLRGTKAGFRQK